MDRELRDLERAFAQSGAIDDEVRLLAHRVRAGLLPPAWLETAARLGHEAARRTLGRFVPVIALGAVPAQLGVVASLRLSLESARCHVESSRDPRVRAAFDAAGAWTDAPGPETARACLEAAAAADAAAQELTDAWQRARAAESPDDEARERARGSWLLRQIAELCRRAIGDPRRPVIGGDAGVPVPDEFRAARERVASWALRPPTAAPPAWPAARETSTHEAALRAATAAFEARLADKATKKAATALRGRLREKTLEKEMVELAADLGHPAAWLVARRDGVPDLAPPLTADEVALRLEVPLDRRAAPVKTRVLQRRHWVDDQGNERSATSWRCADGEVRRPEWARAYLDRVALRLAERALPLAEAGSPEEARAARASMDALRELVRERGRSRAATAATRGRGAARASSSSPAGAALRLLAAAATFAARSERDRGEGRLGGDGPIEAAVHALGAPAALWDDLRAALAAWALGEEQGEARPYDPAAAWSQGELLEHPKFGRGRVAKVEGGKLEVVFADGSRVLALRR